MKTFKKQHNKYSAQVTTKQHLLTFGNIGVKNLSFSRLTESQLSSILWIIQKKLKHFSDKKRIKLWVKVYTNLVLTKLSTDSRMGKGKGVITETAVFLKPGQIIFELSNLSKNQSDDFLQFISKKFPGKLLLISRPQQQRG